MFCALFVADKLVVNGFRYDWRAFGEEGRKQRGRNSCELQDTRLAWTLLADWDALAFIIHRPPSKREQASWTLRLYKIICTNNNVLRLRQCASCCYYYYYYYSNIYPPRDFFSSLMWFLCIFDDECYAVFFPKSKKFLCLNKYLFWKIYFYIYFYLIEHSFKSYLLYF